VAWQLVGQARACQVMGSPLYAHLLATAAQDVLGGGRSPTCWSPAPDRAAVTRPGCASSPPSTAWC
jgi:hypothetical protein